MKGWSLAACLVLALPSLTGCGKEEEPFSSASSQDYDGDGWIDDDCDPDDPDVNPGATECFNDGVDNDCDTGTPDEVDDGEAPQIVSFVMADGGPHDFGEGEVPSLEGSVAVTDNLDQASLLATLWFDSVADGAVDTSGAGTEIILSISDAGCIGGALDAELSFFLSLGGALSHDTTYDFALAVTDAAGNTSEPASATLTTPSE